MPFDDLLTPVAVSPVQRHDEPTCCGERQVPDVGEGWRLLGADEVLQEGDQCDVGANEPCWVNTVCVGDRAGDGCVGGGCDRYRRRVTPDVQVEAMSITDTWAAEVARLSAENHLLKAEVERLRLLPEERAAIKRMIGEPDSHSSWAESRCAKLLRDMLKRQGGGE